MAGSLVVGNRRVAGHRQSAGKIERAVITALSFVIRKNEGRRGEILRRDRAGRASRDVAGDFRRAADRNVRRQNRADVAEGLVAGNRRVAGHRQSAGEIERAVIAALSFVIRKNEGRRGEILRRNRAGRAACDVAGDFRRAADRNVRRLNRADVAGSLVAGDRRVAGNRHRSGDIRAAVRSVRGVADDFEIAADGRALRVNRSVIAASDVAVESRIADDVRDGVNAQRAVAAACGILIRDEVASDLESASAQRAVATFDSLVAGNRRVASNRRRSDDISAAVRRLGGVADDFERAADGRGLCVERADICVRRVVREVDVLLDVERLANISGAVAPPCGIAHESRRTVDLESRLDAQCARVGHRGVVVRGQIAANGERASLDGADLATGDVLVRDEVSFNAKSRAGETADI